MKTVDVDRTETEIKEEDLDETSVDVSPNLVKPCKVNQKVVGDALATIPVQDLLTVKNKYALH